MSAAERGLPTASTGGGGASTFVITAAVAHRHRRDLLLHAVFVDLEFVLAQIGNEVAFLVAGNDVGRDQIDLNSEGRLLCLGLRRLSRRGRLGAETSRRGSPARPRTRTRRIFNFIASDYTSKTPVPGSKFQVPGSSGSGSSSGASAPFAAGRWLRASWRGASESGTWNPDLATCCFPPPPASPLAAVGAALPLLPARAMTHWTP